MSPILQSLANGSARGYRSFAAAAGPAFESIASATGTGSSNTITFSSIPSTYQSLQIRGNFLGTTSGQAFFLRFNSDTGTNYTRHRIYGTSSTLAIGAQATVSAISPGAYNGTSTSHPCATIIDVENYTNTSINKVARFFAGLDINAAQSVVEFGSGLWINTSAITTITLSLSGGSFTTDSTFALYGIKGV